MLTVALTGNIAAGKSTVVELFRRWGATVIDADELARQAQTPGSEVLAMIARRFGADVMGADGLLDRAALRAKVMGDDRALADLNAIVHPAVRRHREDLMRAARDAGDAIVVNDIPLLFEALDPADFDAVVLVDAPVPLRRTRLRTLRGLPNEDADRMISAQMPAERKRARSHYVIENAGTLAELEPAARWVFAELRRRAAPDAAFRCSPVLLAAADARDSRDVLEAIAARYADARGVVRRVPGKRPALLKELKGSPPEATITTAAVKGLARTAWADAGRPGRFYWLDPGPSDSAEAHDLRPWGGPRLRLGCNPFA